MLRLDFVSPLPPVRSGIADYSRDLLPELARRADVRLIALPDSRIDPELAARWRPVPAARLGEEGRLPLYQMGNNRHHAAVARLALATPGVVTLHDLVLHHLLVEETLGREDLDAYRERLVADHGWVGALVGRARRWGELSSAAVFELPAHRTLVRRQRGVLVHSRWAAMTLAEEDPELAVRVVPMGVPLPVAPPPDAAARFRRRRGLPLDRPLLGSFGFQTPIKRTEVAIRALAEEPLAAAHLLVVGEVAGVLDLEGIARAAGVAERVHLVDFLPYDEFEAAIVACDLCVNLRYPTAGETSASLLRVLALGRPTLVSDYAQFAELPDEIALKVPLGEGEAASAAALAGEVLAAPERLAAMGRAARRWVAERHDPGRAAERIVAAAAELGELAPPAGPGPEIPAPTTLLWHELPGKIEVRGAEAPWPPGERRELAVRLENRGVARWLATREQPGGVILDVQWRRERGGEAVSRSWAELPAHLDPGQGRDFTLALRRPREGRVLVVEPHVENVAGFGAFGGPSWVEEY